MPEDNSFNISVYAKTDVGRVRAGNEDNFLVVNLSTAETWTLDSVTGPPPKSLIAFIQGHYGLVASVSDGMGGALAGEVASRLAVEGVRDRMLELQSSSGFSKFPFSERLRLALELANLHIHYESLNHKDYQGMGATFTSVGILENTAYFAQVGDSRAYLLRQGAARQITRDQSLVSQLLESGHLTEEEAEQYAFKNVILQALGASPYVKVAVSKIALQDADTLLVCSDGLSGKVRGEEMVSIVEGAPSLEAGCGLLIDLANKRGGEDNITVVIVHVEGGVLAAAGQAASDHGTIEELEIETIDRDPALPEEVDSLLLDSDDDTLPEV
ncbi:MAG TPA: protein phosphatase 2C domain-containing protein [Blastocatellia bacterium]